MSPLAGVATRISRWPPAVQCGFWIVLAGILVTVQLAIVRHIAHAINVFEIVLLRSVFGLIVIAPMLMRDGHIYLRPNRPSLTMLCGTLAFAATVCFYLAAKHLPIADITAIHFSRPVFAAIVAAIVLGETIRGSRTVAIVAGLIGAAIIVRPGFVALNIGVLYVFGVVAVQSVNPIVRKILSRSEHPDTVATWNPLVMILPSLIVTLFVWTTPTPAQLGWMVLLGVIEIANQRVIGRAYLQGDAVLVVALHYTRLPLAALLGFIVFGEVPAVWIWIGGAIIAASSIWLAWRETRTGAQAGGAA